MFHSILLWVAAIASILGIAFYVIEKLFSRSIVSTPITLGLVISGMLLGVILAITEKTRQKELSHPQIGTAKNQVNIQGKSSVNIHQVGDTTYGDTTTTAEQRGKNALEEISKEIMENFRNLSLVIGVLERKNPTKFWDIRRANETELAYQDRAKNAFRDYQNDVKTFIEQLNFSDSRYKSFQRDLAHLDERIRDSVKRTYDNLNEVTDSFRRFETGLSHIVSLDLDDQERTARALSLHNEKIVNAKMAIMFAASQFSLIVKNEADAQTVLGYLSSANMSINLQPGEAGYQAAIQMATHFAAQKVQVMAERVIEIDEAKHREIQRRITDPYLLMLRKAVGLGDTLSDTEIGNIKNKKINMEETDPEKLLILGAQSYTESDGQAAITYYERARQASKLSPLQRKFITISLDRLKHPAKYENSIGIMILKITSGGSFEKAGLNVGDVLLSLDGSPLNEPLDIASAFGKGGTDPFVMRIIRDDEPRKVVIHGGGPVGALLTQLIVLNAIQL